MTALSPALRACVLGEAPGWLYPLITVLLAVRAGRALRGLIKEAVEATTALACRIGEYVVGGSVQREILRNVTGATVLLADISGDGPNVYIEIGAARAVDVPVALLRKGPPGRPSFMLRDQQVWDYGTDAELLGRAVRVSYPYRRYFLSGG